MLGIDGSRDKFQLDNGVGQCPIAQAVYANCIQSGIVSPVWECRTSR
jgi:hypothetical protein